MQDGSRNCDLYVGPTGVRNIRVTQEKSLPRLSRILVYDFAGSQREVTEYQGIMRQQPSNKDPVERRRQIACRGKRCIGKRNFGRDALAGIRGRAGKSQFIC